MSDPAVDQAEPVGGGPPPAPRWRGPLVAAAVVLVGLGLGTALALVVRRGAGDPVAADAEVRLAVATQFGLAPDGATCVLDGLDAAGELDDALAEQLVADALAGSTTPSAAVADALAACGSGRLLDAFTAAGVPDEVAGCAAATVADQPADVQAAVVARPLVEGGPGREAVAACALEHLATVVEAQAGIDGVDARCVAGELIDRLGLGPVLASIGALAVTPEVGRAAADAAVACAAGT